METYDLSVVIPVYNEVDSINNTIHEVLMHKKKIKLEIIVVDDGSSDGTREKLNELEENDIKVIKHEQNLGYGAALKSGIRSASSNLIAITDADGTYPNNQIYKLFKEITKNNYDMIIGARTGYDAKIPLIRRPAKYVIKRLCQYLTSYKIPDVNSGLRIFKKNIAKRFFNILPDGFSFTTTITLAMIKNSYKLKYVQIPYNVRIGKSKIKPIQDTINFLQLILKTILYFDPFRIFIPLSSFFMLLGIFFGAYRVIVGKGFILVSILMFVLSVQFFAIGLLADLIVKRAKENESL